MPAFYYSNFVLTTNENMNMIFSELNANNKINSTSLFVNDVDIACSLFSKTV